MSWIWNYGYITSERTGELGWKYSQNIHERGRRGKAERKGGRKAQIQKSGFSFFIP